MDLNESCKFEFRPHRSKYYHHCIAKPVNKVLTGSLFHFYPVRKI